MSDVQPPPHIHMFEVINICSHSGCGWSRKYWNKALRWKGTSVCVCVCVNDAGKKRRLDWTAVVLWGCWGPFMHCSTISWNRIKVQVATLCGGRDLQLFPWLIIGVEEEVILDGVGGAARFWATAVGFVLTNSVCGVDLLWLWKLLVCVGHAFVKLVVTLQQTVELTRRPSVALWERYGGAFLPLQLPRFYVAMGFLPVALCYFVIGKDLSHVSYSHGCQYRCPMALGITGWMLSCLGATAPRGRHWLAL